MAEGAAPASIAGLQKALASANAGGTRVHLVGGGTLHAMGAPPPLDALRLSTARLRKMIAHEARDMTCAVQCGVRLRELEAALGAARQFIALDAPLRAKATVGGTLAAGWLGPRRHRYGRPRDLLIGTQCVLADGTLLHAGGMVVKNVSGYDMNKLYAGSFGTLAAIAQANFKTLPIPERRRLLIAPLPENTQLRAARALAELPIAPAAAVCVEGFRKAIDGEDAIDGRALVLLEGSDAVVERATREARSALGRAGVSETEIVDSAVQVKFERIIDACIQTLGERSVTFRCFGPPASAGEQARALRDIANAHRLFTDLLWDVMNGDVFLRVSDHDKRSFAEKIEACDDELRARAPARAIVAGDAPIRTALDPWGDPPAAIEKMRAIKAWFDPHGILNPGCFVGGI